METTLIAALLKLGAPWVVAAVFIWLYLSERTYARELTTELRENASMLSEVVTKATVALEAMRGDLDDIKARGRRR